MINERQYTRIIKKSEGLQIKNENFSFGKHSVTFDVNELPRGIYLLMLQTEDGVSIRRLVKQ